MCFKWLLLLFFGYPLQCRCKVKQSRARSSYAEPQPAIAVVSLLQWQRYEKKFPPLCSSSICGGKRGIFFSNFASRISGFRHSRFEGRSPGLRPPKVPPPAAGGGTSWGRRCRLRHADGTQCHHQFLVAPYPELQVVKGTLLRLRLLEVEPSQLAFSIVSDYKWCHGKRLNVFLSSCQDDNRFWRSHAYARRNSEFSSFGKFLRART